MRSVLPVLLAGCLTRPVDEVAEVLDFDGAVTSVFVTVPRGDWTVEVGGVGRAELTRTARWTGDEPDVAAWLDGSALHVEVVCRSLQLTCEVDHALRLPSPATLNAELGSGSIVASGLVGPVEVWTGDGEVALAAIDGPVVAGGSAVRVEDVTGPLILDSGAGEIAVIGATSTEVSAVSESGNVDLELLVRPEQVTVDSGSGDIGVAVPTGSYRIEAQTGSGEVWISGLSADDGADAVLDLETGRGNIGVEGR